MKTQDTKEAFLLTLKNTKRKMPRVPAHLCERSLGMLQGGMRTADVARAINCNVRTVKRLGQRYRETGRTADRPQWQATCYNTCTGSVHPNITPAGQVQAGNKHCPSYTRTAQSLHPCSDSPQLTERGWTEGLQVYCKAGPHQTSSATTSPMGTNPPLPAQTALAKRALH